MTDEYNPSSCPKPPPPPPAVPSIIPPRIAATNDPSANKLGSYIANRTSDNVRSINASARTKRESSHRNGRGNLCRMRLSNMSKKLVDTSSGGGGWAIALEVAVEEEDDNDDDDGWRLERTDSSAMANSSHEISCATSRMARKACTVIPLVLLVLPASLLPMPACSVAT
mmetsp:Transcript_16318/g.39039  ORF Transcript_16318/g.39039 Transcript_16318/m.39039 type:complete len:169 (+) Transcript_16318:384-890(+)